MEKQIPSFLKGLTIIGKVLKWAAACSQLIGLPGSPHQSQHDIQRIVEIKTIARTMTSGD
jgi:hypothetical protein